MQVKLIDNKNWRDQTSKIIDVDTLDDQWIKVKEFINKIPTADIIIRLDAGGTGKLFVDAGGTVGSHSFDLFLFNGVVNII